MPRILSFLLGLGFVGVITGGIAGAAVIFLAHLIGLSGSSVITAAYFSAAAAGFFGLILDVRYDVSASIQARIWQGEIAQARRLLWQGEIDYQEALEKAFNASYELSQPAIYLLRPFAGSKVAKQNREDKLWVVQNVLPLISLQTNLKQERNLEKLEEMVRELADDLRTVREGDSLLQKLRRWIKGGGSGTAAKVAERYLARHDVSRRVDAAGPTLTPLPEESAIPETLIPTETKEKKEL
jgi:hypothetical protein